MKLPYLAWRNMISKPLNLVLSVALLALSVALVTFTVQLDAQMQEQLNRNVSKFDMVVGAKGSPLQLVLSSLLHIDAPTGNIPLKEAERIKNHPFVAQAIPVSYGDNYKGYRMLGTLPSYVETYGATIQEGRIFDKSFQVVAGSRVAKELNLSIGDTFSSSHGLAAGGHSHDHLLFTVVGILSSTGTVIDKLLLSDLESVWLVHGHDSEAKNAATSHTPPQHDHEEENQKPPPNEPIEERENLEITSLLVSFKNPMGLVQMPRYINQNTSMQAALPGYEVSRLLGFLGIGAETLWGIGIAILLVSAFSIFIFVLKTIRERKQELALLRIYGLGTPRLLLLVLLEGAFMSIVGVLFGWVLGRLGIAFISNFISVEYGYELFVNGPTKIEGFFFLGILLLTSIGVFIASTSIFKLNISKTLGDA